MARTLTLFGSAVGVQVLPRTCIVEAAGPTPTRQIREIPANEYAGSAVPVDEHGSHHCARARRVSRSTTRWQVPVVAPIAGALGVSGVAAVATLNIAYRALCDCDPHSFVADPAHGPPTHRTPEPYIFARVTRRAGSVPARLLLASPRSDPHPDLGLPHLQRS